LEKLGIALGAFPKPWAVKEETVDAPIGDAPVTDDADMAAVPRAQTLDEH
jgi:hypothetical protein